MGRILDLSENTEVYIRTRCEWLEISRGQRCAEDADGVEDGNGKIFNK
jgi:hypothetical protein